MSQRSYLAIQWHWRSLWQHLSTTIYLKILVKSYIFIFKNPKPQTPKQIAELSRSLRLLKKSSQNRYNTIIAVLRYKSLSWPDYSSLVLSAHWFTTSLTVIPLSGKSKLNLHPGAGDHTATQNYLSQTVTYPPVVCTAVVKLGDDLLAAILQLGPRKLKLVWDEHESGSVIIRNINLDAKKRKKTYIIIIR